MIDENRTSVSNERPPVDSPENRNDAQHKIVLVLSGDAYEVRNSLLQLLDLEGWSVNNKTPWSGIATKGNFIMTILFGAFAQFHKIGYAITAGPNGATVVRVHRATAGAFGGLWGMHKVRREFDEQAEVIRDHLESQFTYSIN